MQNFSKLKVKSRKAFKRNQKHESLRSFLHSRNIFEDHIQNRTRYVKHGNKIGESLCRTSWTKLNNLMLSFKAEINV